MSQRSYCISESADRPCVRGHGRRRVAAMLAAGLSIAAICPVARAGLNSGAEWIALDNFYIATNGSSWTDHTNWLAGDACQWHGVQCDQDNDTADNTSHVTRLHLEANHLTGQLPASLNAWPSLQDFYVYDNDLTGTLPDLSGNPNLVDFEAKNNPQLTGSIPALTGLTKLQTFYVYDNPLITGTIPAFTGLTALFDFEAEDDSLNGPIPDLAGLTNLKYLVLGNNQLDGQIPSLSDLTNLYTFDVGNNLLTGPIPDLSSSTMLHAFYVGNNLLEGAVPEAPLTLANASLCPNRLDTTPQPSIDPTWNAATGNTPWWAVPYSNNACDDLFTNGFGG